MADWLKSLFGRTASPSRADAIPETDELARAEELLDSAMRPACFAQLGGFRPDDPNDRFRSWWGGNFLGEPDEGVPVCDTSGRTMLPFLQIRTGELPHVPDVFDGIALLTLWFDPDADDLWESENGAGFTIRTYRSLDGLGPVGHGYKEHATLPTFPIRWHLMDQDLPHWEAFVGDVPDAVARSADSDWFFGHPGHDARAKLQETMPVKVGGYSQWWQSPLEVDGGRFAFFLDTTARGSLRFPGGGNANFFRTTNGWALRVDCP